jgi:hypothetical protein
MIAKSNHAVQRAKQRGFGDQDIALVLTHGTETRDGVFMRRQDVIEAIERRREEIRRLERLGGVLLVIKNSTLVTCYHTTKRKSQRVLRKAH